MADGTPRPPRRDPFADMAPATIAAVLVDKGWRGVARQHHDVVLSLGRVVVVATDGAPGLLHLERMEGAHGSLPAGPSWSTPTQRLRAFLAPEGVRLTDAPNLHGVVPGVHLRTRGDLLLPPSLVDGVQQRWAVGVGHPAVAELPKLPEWLLEIVRDPAKAAKAWSTTRPAPGAVRSLAEWEQGLTRSRGRTVNTFGNVCKILRSAPPYTGRFRLNLLTQAIEFEGQPLPEGAVGVIREQIEDAPYGGFSPAKEHLYDAVRSLAEASAFHPVQEYLRALPAWDGVERLDFVSKELLHAEDDPLVAACVRKWFISAVARALDPGCQVDTALVLVGPQGYRKSSFFRTLAPFAFADTEIRIGDKDGLQQIHAAWITEWGELDRITSARHAGDVKAFVSRRADTFRPPYGRITATFQRSCVIVGSTNESEFLTDPTGSRRFWVVRVGAPVDVPTVAAARDQLWAEAFAAYRSGEQWWLDAEQDRAREVAAEQYRVRDPWEGVVARWVVESWPKLKREKGYPYLTSDLVLRGALRLEPKDMSHGATCRVGRVMAGLGFTGARKRLTKAELARCPGHVLVHAWERLDTEPEETDDASFE